MPPRLRVPGTGIYLGGFVFLLVSILLLLLVRPFLDGLVPVSPLINAFFTVVLISAVYAISERKKRFYTVAGIAAAAVLCLWTGDVLGQKPLRALGEISAVVFFALTVYAILAYLFRETRITMDVIVGSVCGYFLIGLLWGFVYPLLEAAIPGSFVLGGAAAVDPGDFTYFSFVTLSTLGYGDMTPVTNEARSLALLEAVTGQLYIAILIARLVGIHIAQTPKSPPGA